ncbi:MAG: hypothetical protein IJ011_05865 [Clostridia bacterium]|nr:hypothetical protein [Clostridia bacterium]
MTEYNGENRKAPEMTPMEQVQSYLEDYTVFRKLLEINEERKKHFGIPCGSDVKAEETLNLPYCPSNAWAEMFERRRFVMSLKRSNERLFLFLHYIHGLSVTKCAELMEISLRGAFRLRRNALEHAAIHFKKYIKISSTTKTYE